MANALLSNIVSVDWQLSTAGYGRIVQGTDDVQQCLGIIFTTQKGSDPLRPDFGIDILSWMDRPINIAAPGIINEMLRGVIYEPRISVTAIQAFEESAKITFKVTWNYVSDFNPKTSMPGVVANPEVAYYVLSTSTGLFVQVSSGDLILANKI